MTTSFRGIISWLKWTFSHRIHFVATYCSWQPYTFKNMATVTAGRHELCHEMLPAVATIRWPGRTYDGHERPCREHSRHLLKFIVTNISKKEFFLIELFRWVRLLSCSCRTNIFIQFEIITSPSNLVLKWRQIQYISAKELQKPWIWLHPMYWCISPALMWLVDV